MSARVDAVPGRTEASAGIRLSGFLLTVLGNLSDRETSQALRSVREDSPIPAHLVFVTIERSPANVPHDARRPRAALRPFPS
jgi:hypothetical protein